MNSFLLFSELLSASIWNRPVKATLFENLNSEIWKEVFTHINAQKVMALIGHSVQSLPKEYQPPKSILYPLLLSMEQTEKLNLNLRNKLVEIASIYKEREIDFILLKGQGNSLAYPRPLHRPPGDLDLFLYQPEYYARSIEWLKGNNIAHGKESKQHTDFDWEGVHIENHHTLTHMPEEKHNQYLKRHINRIVDNNLLRTVDIGSTKIKLLPPTFNSFYLFLHLFKHFMSVGIGIRHLCDWVLLLNHYKEEIDQKEYLELTTKFNLLRPMQEFALVSTTLLNTPKEIFPFEVPNRSRYTDKIIEDIRIGGNFGYFRPGLTFKKGRKEMSKRYLQAIERTIKFGPIAPRYSYLQLWKRTCNRIRLTFRR